MPGLVPGIHVLLFGGAKTWMAGTSPAMTKVRQVTPSTFALRATADRPTDLPDGLFCKSPVQPHLQKYFRSRLTQITSISLTVSFHRGADRASSRTRGGMRWTRERQARNGNRRAR